jgi:hypothetical protein
MNDPARVSSILKAVPKPFSEAIAFVELSKEQTAGITGDAAAIEIPGNVFAKEASKTKLFVADCIHKGILAKELFLQSQQDVSRCPFFFEA